MLLPSKGGFGMKNLDRAPDAADRHRILAENPQTLYGFAKI